MTETKMPPQGIIENSATIAIIGMAVVIARATSENELITGLISSGTPTARCKKIKKAAKAVNKIMINPGV